ncbi:MarR family transcriptional regulator [Priestia megaterium]|nr:MarR family transcriptional regulator [Priestia megaterium]
MTKQNIDNLQEVFSEFMIKSIPKWLNVENRPLSRSQFVVLKVLKEHGPQKISDLSRELNVTLSAITNLSEKLIDESYIERKRCEDDRRVVRLFITKKGLKLYQTVADEQHEKIGQLQQFLSEDEIDFLVKIYRKMLDNLF